MAGKAKIIFLNMALSVAVFFGTALLSAIVLGWMLGSKIGADGQEEIKGGGMVSLIVLGVSTAVTITFAIWFKKFLTNYKNSKIKE